MFIEIFNDTPSIGALVKSLYQYGYMCSQQKFDAINAHKFIRVSFVGLQAQVLADVELRGGEEKRLVEGEITVLNS